MMTDIGLVFLKKFLSLFITIFSSIGNCILLMSLLYLSFQILKKKIKLYVIVEIGIFIAVISSIFVFIDDISQLTNLLLQGKIIHNWFNRSLIGYFTSFMVYIIFPILFIFYLAWKVEIPLVTRYGIILGYAFFIIMLSSVGFVIALEQIIPDKMACVGISCLPVKCTQKLQN